MFLRPLLFALCLSATGCGVPFVDVKQRWNKAFVSYSFMPIYPARSDVNIGDVRIHTIEISAEALDSRLISDYTNNKLAKKPDFATAVLPGVEALRLVSVDTESVGLSGLVRRLLGSKVEASSSLYISLQKLSTAEVADKDIARQFVKYLQDEAGPTPYSLAKDVADNRTRVNFENKFVWGLCAAAKTFDDPEFEDLGISVVTRVVRSERIAYYSGRSLSNAPNPALKTSPAELPKDPADAAAQASKNATGNTFTAQTGSSLPVQDLPEPVVVGADALMIYPKVVIPDLVERCKVISLYFADSQLERLRNRRPSSAGRPN